MRRRKIKLVLINLRYLKAYEAWVCSSSFVLYKVKGPNQSLLDVPSAATHELCISASIVA
jgi:hypothetical protein